MPWSQYGLRALPDGAPVFREAREKLKFARSFPNAREIIARTPPLSLSPIPIAVMAECLRTGQCIIEITQ